MFDDIFSQVSPEMAAKNIRKQATKILKDLESAYSLGLLDTPESAYKFCSLLACICEGKVEGVDIEGQIKWTLTKEYHAKLLEVKGQLLPDDTNVIRGPWGIQS